VPGGDAGDEKRQIAQDDQDGEKPGIEFFRGDPVQFLLEEIFERCEEIE
jgi:hypothetical protein